MVKSNSTKKALILALLSTLLCVSMLVGTTFAWFTDTASVSVNTIRSGKLDVQLVDADGNELTEALKWVSADADATEILWEPGCTYKLQSFYVKNNGNLALKYKVVISGVDGDAKLLDVLTFTYQVGEDAFTADSEFQLAAGVTSGEFVITAHMDETAGTEYMNLSVEGITITVYATQDVAESDSNGNEYDKDATYPVTNADGLKNAFANGGVIVAASNIAVVPAVADTTVSTLVAQATVTADTTLNLAGKTWGVDASAAGSDYGKASVLLLAVTSGTLTVTGNGVMNCEAGNNQVYGINVNGGHVVIENGTFYGAMTAVQVQKGSLEIKGGFFDMAPTCKSVVPQYAKYMVNCIDSAWKDGTATITITGGTFVNFDPSNNPEGANTSYVADGYKVVAETQANGDVWYTVVAE